MISQLNGAANTNQLSPCPPPKLNTEFCLMPPVTSWTYNNLHKLKIRGGTLSQNLQWQPKLQKASWQPYFACKDQTHQNRTSFHYEKVTSRWHSSLLHYHRRLPSSYGNVILIKPLPLQSFHLLYLPWPKLLSYPTRCCIIVNPISVVSQLVPRI